MREIQVAHSFGDVARLIRIERAGFAFTDCAETAMARARVTGQHKGRCAIRPTLEDVRAARFLTNGVEI